MSSAAKVIKAASSVISGIDSIAEREKLLDLVPSSRNRRTR